MNKTKITIREETPADYVAVHHLNELAFEQPNEANLVDALREKAETYISLVAVLDDQIVGHIFFSAVTIEAENESFSEIGLAPMAVFPKYQNQGIGSKLVEVGLNECEKLGFNIVVVLGHPQYYPRFGFIPASQKALSCEYNVPDDVFMVLELKEGALKGRKGLVKYHPEFGKF